LTNSVTTDKFKLLYKTVDNPFFMAVKNDRCVVCGVDSPLTKHHVVPRRMLPHIPGRVKSRMSNVLFVCTACHRRYNENDIAHDETDPNVWLAHFLKVMEPKFMPEGWNIFMVRPEIEVDDDGEPVLAG
jgi:hypothetical protein